MTKSISKLGKVFRSMTSIKKPEICKNVIKKGPSISSTFKMSFLVNGASMGSIILVRPGDKRIKFLRVTDKGICRRIKASASQKNIKMPI